MSKHAPMMYVWDKGCFTPHPYFRSRAAEQFVDGQMYRLEQVEERDMNSHRHYFACIYTAWQNVSEFHASKWPTPDHLRKYALTFTRFRKTLWYEAKSKAETLRVANAFSAEDEHIRVEIIGRSVLRHIPMSQSLTNMSKREFQESKQAVLAVLADLIGVSLDDLEDNARRAA
jgi:hypothetical protein